MQGVPPLHPGGDVIPAPLTFYNIAPSVAALPATLGAISYYKKAREREGSNPSQWGVGVLPPLHGVKMNERADSFYKKRGAIECLRIFTT